ncbi:hypothetical protein JIP62_06970 [Brevundimonas vitis]|uniref:DNA 5'-3' helicase n=1 Tax=Brevundimonas vitisensis TaxID=2800818 RepID=A0ABX7BQI0_9CAUL|nr:DnaB-like helicase C-terminal domain-containing protein [Brevundimonas vitisensis]QQQ19820.1 hypothetical protein JIP62_06970 [Brevundimonas vitisensis]
MIQSLWNAEVELHALAASIYSPGQCDTAFERLTPEAFVDPVHSRIWAAVLDLRSSGSGMDPQAIAHRLGDDRGFNEWGGVRALFDVIEKASPLAIDSLTGILCDLQTRRALDALGVELVARARDTADETGDAILATFERRAAEVAQKTSVDTAWLQAGDMIEEAIATARARNGAIRYPVGIRDVDKILGGLNAGETTIVAAWTGMGKTIAGLQIAKANGSLRKGVAFFSLEMGAAPMGMRLACDLAYDRSAPAFSGRTTNITINRAIAGDLSEDEFARLTVAQQTASRWPIHFDVRPGRTVQQIEAATVRLHREWRRVGIEPGPVIIDHIGKIRPTQDRKGNVTAETRDVSNDLDIMAKRLGVPVVALCQLNRTVENGPSKDKRPSLSSIKDSGAIAENARQVIFIYRPEYYYREPFEHEDIMAKAERLAELQKVKNHFYWIIDKNSNGPRGQALSYCMTDCSAVRDWTS